MDDPLDRAIEALRKARDKFAEYAQLHAAKGTIDGSHKALVNESMAAMCDEARAALAAVDAQTQAEPEPWTNERIDRVADLVVREMPDGIQGFLKVWGWQQFARALLADCGLTGFPSQPLVEIPPDARAGKEPCGERHLKPGELCDICGAVAEQTSPRWVIVRETVLDVGHGNDVRTGGRPELGYALIANAVTFSSEDDAHAALIKAGLPIGWVIMPLSRLLPDLVSIK